MSDSAFISILVAEDNDMSREVMMSILKAQNFKVFGVCDGGEAIEMLEANTFDLALVDINMAPQGGFEFVRHLRATGTDLPVVIITSDDTSDMLIEANALDVTRVLQKPVVPERLIQTVNVILKRRGFNPDPMGVEQKVNNFSAEQLMGRAIEVAEYNVRMQKGGPFGAIVADANGQIIGEAASRGSSRADPMAYAEALAIYQASEKLGREDLSDCTLYCTSEPTIVGRAMIANVNIQNVVFALSHDDMRSLSKPSLLGERKEPKYLQLGRNEAIKLFK